MPKVYCFGSEHFDGDEVALRLAPLMNIAGYEFIIADSPSIILKSSHELLLMDVVKGISCVCLIEDIDSLSQNHSLTCHDLDVGFYLKLLKESGKIDSVKIIALPFGESDLDKLKLEVEKIIAKV